jgi:hypothetical protein
LVAINRWFIGVFETPLVCGAELHSNSFDLHFSSQKLSE